MISFTMVANNTIIVGMCNVIASCVSDPKVAGLIFIRRTYPTVPLRATEFSVGIALQECRQPIHSFKRRLQIATRNESSGSMAVNRA
jgi:hypothetical protein